MKIIVNLSQYSLFILSAFVVAVSSCTSDDTPATPAKSSPMGTMSAKIDNVPWVATDVPGTLLKLTSFDSKRLDLRGSADDQRIILTLEDVFEGDCVNIGDYTFDDFYGGNALFTYSTLTAGGGSITQHFPIEGTFSITECDLANKTVSGTFNFKSEKVGTYDTLVVTDGVFNDYPYTVLEQ